MSSHDLYCLFASLHIRHFNRCNRSLTLRVKVRPRRNLAVRQWLSFSFFQLVLSLRLFDASMTTQPKTHVMGATFKLSQVLSQSLVLTTSPHAYPKSRFLSSICRSTSSPSRFFWLTKPSSASCRLTSSVRPISSPPRPIPSLPLFSSCSWTMTWKAWLMLSSFPLVSRSSWESCMHYFCLRPVVVMACWMSLRMLAVSW